MCNQLLCNSHYIRQIKPVCDAIIWKSVEVETDIWALNLEMLAKKNVLLYCLTFIISFLIQAIPGRSSLK